MPSFAFISYESCYHFRRKIWKNVFKIGYNLGYDISSYKSNMVTKNEIFPQQKHGSLSNFRSFLMRQTLITKFFFVKIRVHRHAGGLCILPVECKHFEENNSKKFTMECCSWPLLTIWGHNTGSEHQKWGNSSFKTPQIKDKKGGSQRGLQD